MRDFKIDKRLGTWSLLALILGAALGWVCKEYLLIPEGISILFETVGLIYIQLLQLIIIPLIFTMLILSINSQEENKIGKLSIITFSIFLLLFLTGAFYTIAVSPVFITILGLGPGSIPSEALTSVSETFVTTPDKAGFLNTLKSIFIMDPMKGLKSSNFIFFLILTIVLAIVLKHIRGNWQQKIIRFINKGYDVTMFFLTVILFLTPLGIFALSFIYTYKIGLEVGGFLIKAAVYESLVHICYIPILYGVVKLFTKVRVKQFAIACYEPQILAMSTRSSLATVPVIIKSCIENLGVSKMTASFVVPIAATFYKNSRTIASTLKLVLLAIIFDIPLDLGDYIIFVFGSIILSISVMGVPGGSAMINIPLFAALGIPVEAYILIKTVTAIPDVFITAVNSTGYQTACLLVDRISKRKFSFSPSVLTRRNQSAS